jgi:hypothetical protein
MSARVARLCLPGPMWFIALCEDCAWVDMSWKDKSWAVRARDAHNATRHAVLGIGEVVK